MREIKFRAWNDKAKKMYYDVDLVNSQWLIEGHYLIYSDKDDIMQYTGLKDKNGKEIYEGDIVKFKFTEGTDAEDNYLIPEYPDKTRTAQDVVKFTTGKFVPMPSYCEIEDTWYSWRYWDFEVIGNIYENKYLINGDK
jgi:uncharacterized phage protein (TIGR01671 family)